MNIMRYILPLLLVIFILFALFSRKKPFESERRRAGRLGEEKATEDIKRVLRKEDHILTNVKVSYEGRPAEFDNIVVNKYGVFIIEVKSYKGRLYGTEDDYEWEKFKDDNYGNTFEKNVKNPIRQVKRQVYILAKYLNRKGVDVWVEGYAYMLYGNSPIKSEYMLKDLKDIDRVIHSSSKKYLTSNEIDRILKTLK